MKQGLVAYWNNLSPRGRQMAIICGVIVLLLLSALLCYEVSKKDISLTINGYETTVHTHGQTVKDLAEDLGYDSESIEDSEPQLNSGISDGDTVTMTVKADYTIAVGGENIKVTTVADNVGDVLTAAGVTYDSDDKIEPDVSSGAEPGAVICVHQREIKEETRTTEVGYSIKYQKDYSLYEGQREIITPGVYGEVVSVYRVTYMDGEIESEELLSRTETQPVTEVVAVGTLSCDVADNISAYNTDSSSLFNGSSSVTINPETAPNGMSATKVMVMRATAYHESEGSLTKSGTLSRVGAIAVDPDVIPLGTRLYVEGYGYCVAEDTGSAIKGQRIDVYLDSEAECEVWGVRYVTVYVLE